MECWWPAWEHLGAPAKNLGCWRQVREQLESQLSSLGKPTSSLGTLHVRREIIPTTYHATIFNTHVFSLYSDLCINVSRKLPIYQVFLDWLQTVLETNSRFAWKCRSSEHRDTLRSCDRVSLEMHLEAVIGHIERYTWRPWMSEIRDALRDRDRAGVEMHLDAVHE